MKRTTLLLDYESGAKQTRDATSRGWLDHAVGVVAVLAIVAFIVLTLFLILGLLFEKLPGQR